MGGKHSNTGKALKSARKLLHDTKSGARKSGAKKVVFLLTNDRFHYGYGTKSHIQVSDLKALKRKATVYVMSMGYKVNFWQLRKIASSWWTIFRVRDYGDLELIAEHVHSCK